MNTTEQTSGPLRTIRLVGGGTYQKEQFDYSTLSNLRDIQVPTLFIGLGGTGTSAVSFLKELYTKVFAGRGGEGAGDIPPGYQFLAFDSAIDDRPANLRSGDEWNQLKGEGLQHGTWEDFHAREDFSPWLMRGVSYSDFATGCQGFRNLGRFLFNLNLHDIQKKVRDAALRACDVPALDRTGQLNIYFFSTLAGGTGSGCILDLAFLLRRMFADRTRYTFRAFLCCPKGFGKNLQLRDRAHAGVYAALREIDFFMNSKRRNRWISELEKNPHPGYIGRSGGSATGVFRFPGTNIEGIYDEPFNHCFLIGESGGVNTKILSEPKDYSKFMARCAFALTAYPVSAKAGESQSFASHINNANQQLQQDMNGVRTAFLVPGLASVHFPLNAAIDLLQIEAGLILLRDLLGGTQKPDDRDEALGFLEETGASASKTVPMLASKLDGLLFQPRTETEELSELLKQGARYDRKDDFFALIERFYGGDSAVKRASEMIQSVWEETIDPKEIQFDHSGERLTPLTLSEWIEGFKKALKSQCNLFLTQQGHRRLMVEDFLCDLQVLLREALLEARLAESEQLNAYETARKEWAQGTANKDSFRARLEDATTRSGVIDAIQDALEVSAVAADYPTEVFSAFQRLQDYLLASIKRDLYEKLEDFVGLWKLQCDLYFNQCINARILLELHRDRLLAELRKEADGLGDDIDRVFSFNMLDEAWRNEFSRAHRLHDVDTLQRIAVPARKDVGDGGGSEWRPLDVIDKAAAVQGVKIEELIAEDIVSALSPFFQQKFNEFAEWKDGQGLRRMIDVARSTADGQAEPYAKIGHLLSRKATPQWDISMNTSKIPGNSTEHYCMIAAAPGIGKRITDSSHPDGEINISLTYEPSRITMLRIAYPVGLAGCAEVHSPFKSTHDGHLIQISSAGGDKAFLKRSFYTYPESWLWEEPVFTHDATYDWGRKLTWAFAVGLLPEHLDASSQAGKAVVDYLAKTPAGGPKDQGIGLFVRGKNEIWCSGFCKIDLSAGSSGVPNPPVLINRGLFAALQTILDTTELKNSVQAWIDWLKDNRTALFSDSEWSALLNVLRVRVQDLESVTAPGTPDHQAVLLLRSGISDLV